MLFAGSEESLVNLIKEDNEILKEGIAHVLAKVGGTIREELATTSRCGTFISFRVDQTNFA